MAKKKNCQPRILYPVKLLLKGERKTFYAKQNLRNFAAYTIRKAKSSSSGWREITPDGKLGATRRDKNHLKW